MNDRIPDDWQTRYAITDAERQASLGRDAYRAIDDAEAMITHVVIRGGTLAEARAHAIQAALHRDRTLTLAELDASIEARRHHTSSTSSPSDVAAAAEPQTTAAPSGALAASPSAAPESAPDLLTAGAA